jgi:transposase
MRFVVVIDSLIQAVSCQMTVYTKFFTPSRHLPNILTYFTHRITNAVAEGLNSKIATIQKRACGFRNRDNFKTAIYFHCGGLDLYPASATHKKLG